MKQCRILDYDFGVIVIDGKVYRHDVIITPGKVIGDWWRLEGHRLQLADISSYLSEDVDYVVIGTGYDGLMRVDENVIDIFRKKGWKVIVKRTREAVDEYNKLVDKGYRVMAFFHLTC